MGKEIQDNKDENKKVLKELEENNDEEVEENNG